MPMAKHKVVLLSELIIKQYVRKSINQDHVLLLAENYEAALTTAKGDDVEASKAIAPILITEELELVDGRHRKEAMELAGLKSCRAEVSEPLTDLEIVTKAAQLNAGGSLPPSREDIQFMVEQLISKFGLTQPQIRSQLNWMPASVCNKYIKMASGHLAEIRRKLALADIAAGVPLKEAAKRHSVGEDMLAEIVTGRKVKSKAGVVQIKGTITASFRAWGTNVSKMVNRSLEDYRDGDITEAAAEDVIQHVEHLVNRLLVRTVDYRNRLRAVKTGGPIPKSEQLGGNWEKSGPGPR